MKRLFALLSLLISLSLTGCGGGGSETPVAPVDEVITGMNIPSSVSAVSDNSAPSSSVTGMSVNWSAVSAAFNSPGTDYSTDYVDSWIDNPTADNINFVNMLLCFIDVSRVEQFPNANYRALIDFNKCEASSGSATPDIASVVVSSTRKTNNSDQIVKLWIDLVGDDGNEKIMVKLIIEESSSSTNPLGKFTMNFTEKADPSRFTGYMKIYSIDSGKSYIKLWETSTWSGAGVDSEVALHIEIDDANGSSGRGISMPEYKIATESQYIDKIAYNSDYVKAFKDSNSSEVCYDRSDLFSSVHRTKLYEKETGDRLDLKGGFSATYTKDGVGGNSAYFGNWGLWTNDNNFEPTQITRREGGDVYDITYAPGNLEKQTQQVAVLADGDMFRFWDWSNSDSEGNVPTVDFAWQASDNTFRKSNGDVKNAYNQSRAYANDDSLYSLQYGYTRYFIDNGVHKLSYTKRERLHPWSDDFASGNLLLKCIGTCPTGGITTAALDNNYNNSDNPNWTDNARSYTFDKNSMTLKYNGIESVVINSGVNDSSRSYNMYDMVLGSSSASTVDEIRNEDTTYRWWPSSQSWGKGTFAKNASGEWYKFDKPVKFEYTHSTANDRNDSSNYNGKTFYLEYNGSYISGIPSVKDSDGRWVRDINLNDGIELYTDSNGKKYVNKSVGIEKKMKKLVSGDTGFDACNALDVSGVSLDIPGVSGVTEITETWDEQNSLPGLSDDILVIHGVIQRGL